jgi:allantoin racemase
VKLLIVNANTTQFVTDRVAAEARLSAAPGTEIVAVTGEFGAKIIATRAENAIAAHAMVDLMARHSQGCDAALIAVSYDTALDASRQLLAMPVVGMTEAALLTACMLGGQIGIVTFGRSGLPMYQELAARYGLASRLAGWGVIESQAAYRPGDTTELDRLIAAEANRLVQEAGAESIILSGAVMAGVPRRLQAQVPVPLVDGISCGVRQAELLAGLKLPKPTVGSYAKPMGREVGKVSDALRQAFES